MGRRYCGGDDRGEVAGRVPGAILGGTGRRLSFPTDSPLRGSRDRRLAI
ncbi:MAG: hypothetical protein AVDCRST_MAG59-3438 [uncultured Thermomicrobiales bacterium]|uniref:Uncharacterized protein n=1 Tax=uncultured Thermomicrobiales bacterium TaxID=1645740 RepID=A0A6J4V6S5_9BACT|nr:MAG: hypothetical protein AVDCRST_MAG59-3438 [uncultured Thermomicrobiales bacterium]